MKPSKKRGAVALVLLSPAFLATLPGCSNSTSSNCDSTRSTPQTSDDCGTGTRRRGGGFYGGGIFRGGGSGSSSSGSVRGGFGSSGRSFGGGIFGGGG